MLALQLAVITAVMATALLAAHVNAADALNGTKITLLQSQNNEFQEKMHRELIQQALDATGANCVEKQANAATAIANVIETLEKRQASLAFIENNREVGGLTQEVFSCIGEKISIGNAERNIILKITTPESFFTINLQTQETGGGK